jgi:ribosomal protein S18 acetylase RimI-like enzyme
MMIFSIRPGEGEMDRPFIEQMNARLVEVIKAPTHTESEVKSFQQGFTASSWNADIVNNATFVAINGQGAPIGYVNVREGNDEIAEGKCGYIALLAVVPEAEGQGVAQSLVNEAEKWARQMGYTRVALDVFASNERGLRFYDKMGFDHETIRVIKKI